MKLLSLLPLVSTALAYAIDRSRIIIPRDSEVKINDFTYNGDTGPLHWHDLDPSNNGACASGRHQSPIDIITEEIGFAAPGSLRLNIPSANTSTFENIGSGLEVLGQGSLLMNGSQYPLKQFHFHTPSEHRVNGEYFPMEAHFVFQTGNETAVVGFLFQLTENQPSFAPFDSIFNHCEEIAEPGNSTQTGPLDFHALSRHLDLNPVYDYTGSLTTPPCTEQVKWFVSQQPLSLSVRDYNDVKRVLKFNARYTQNTLGEDNLLA
ncbi:carbonic anhydrase [Aspergillus steynii IBT 23096]|uniref:Carbonic anhydrase n=1 Tax=Aspergillus steynii IBT 23096 TaxID=1392250 RepID=A0A2I2FUB8_9EURO|nr:carbonic anhydrase [Aspergillus steynii IBT 23096]PLB44201.1 carbonic anhydrase [Aspergillus steynii IBT 23096]